MSTVSDWFGIPSATTMGLLKDLNQSGGMHDERQEEMKKSRKSIAITLIVIPLVITLMWILSLILTAVSAAKLNDNMIRITKPFEAIPFAKRDVLIKLGSAAQFLWWMPGINIILASIFTHKAFNSKLL